MSIFEAWIGDCDLRQIEGEGEYRCQAAVWADSADTFRARLAAFAEKQGYVLFWAEECHPVSQYLQRHGTPHKIGALARAVNQDHHVELSKLVAVSSGEPEPPQNYLFIQETEGVEPLDDQFGERPLKNVPDTLLEPLFGQPEPTEAEIAQYGSVEAVPPMRTYAIVHAEKFQWQSDEIEKCELPYRCLFKGEAADERKNEAPYLIELAEGAGFTRRLFTYNPKMPDNMTSVHLWHMEPGMYVRSRASLDDVWRHFRRFTRFQNEYGKWFHFRFWEGSIFPVYWKHFATSYPHVARFFCSRDFAQSYQIFFIHDGVLTHVAPDTSALKKDPEHVPPFGLTPEDHAFFQSRADENFKNKIKLRLFEKLDKAPDEQKERIVETVDGAFNYIKARNGGALVNLDDCFTLSLLAILWGNAAGAILKGPVLNEPLVPINHRIALSRETYFETMKQISEKG